LRKIKNKRTPLSERAQKYNGKEWARNKDYWRARMKAFWLEPIKRRIKNGKAE